MVGTDPVLVRVLGDPIHSASGSEVRFACPFCNSVLNSHTHKMPLYLNPKKGRWFCHRCEEGGSIEGLYRRLGLAYLYTHPECRCLDDMVSLLEEEEEKAEEAKVLPVPPLQPLTTAGYNYLRDRGISDWSIRRYRIFEGARNEAYDLRGRVVFVDEDEHGIPLYWVGRTFVGHRNKYRNAPVSRRDQVYQLRRVLRRDIAVLVEGPISAVIASQALGDRIIAGYGKHVTDRQLALIAAAGFREVCVALDGDAVGKAYAIAAMLRSSGVETSVLEFPGHDDDPASVPPYQLAHLFCARRPYDPLVHMSFMVQSIGLISRRCQPVTKRAFTLDQVQAQLRSLQ